MTMTINSGTTPYCTPAIFVQIFDYRSFSQLASDTDIPLASSAALQASAILGVQLQIAAGNIEMAATVGARYDPTDLAALISPTITNSGYALIEMNASLAAAGMYNRRFEAIPDDIQKRVDDAMAKLAALEAGTAIFGFDETQQAGLTQFYNETDQDVINRNLPSWNARRCLGRRDNTLPYGNQGQS